MIIFQSIVLIVSVNYGRRVESARVGSITGFEDENR